MGLLGLEGKDGMLFMFGIITLSIMIIGAILLPIAIYKIIEFLIYNVPSFIECFSSITLK
jgi:hypothetical protein